MNRSVRLFINEQAVDAPEGMPLRALIADRDSDLVGRLDAGTAFVTDGVGRRISPDTPAEAGAIYRVVRSARRPPTS